MRKLYGYIAIGLLLFAGITAFYLWQVDLNVPVSERNTDVDPATFMTQEQLEKAEAYSRINYILYFLSLPYEWGIYLLILGLGISSRLQKWGEEVHRWSWIQVSAYVFLFSILTTLLFLPLRGLRFYLGHTFGVTTQSLHSWIEDIIKGYWVDLAITIPVVWFLFWMIRKSPKRWWVYTWIVSIPFILFLSFIQPIVLDPIFNEFKPLQNEELKEKILALADKADIPAEQVFEVDMSEKTKAMNAYVTGIGPSTRIVLWDTTLQKLDANQILVIMAHEMGHYVMKHVFWSTVGSIALSFVFFWLLNRILKGMVDRVGERWGIKEIHHVSVYPLILLLASIMSFVSSPLTNWVSRQYEHRADVYALEMTQDPESMVSMFQRLSTEGLSHPNPPELVKFFIYTHPTIVERIRFANEFATESANSE